MQPLRSAERLTVKWDGEGAQMVYGPVIGAYLLVVAVRTSLPV